jgi:hypothetical protein
MPVYGWFGGKPYIPDNTKIVANARLHVSCFTNPSAININITHHDCKTTAAIHYKQILGTHNGPEYVGSRNAKDIGTFS